jgi:UPF0755 protein
MKLRYILYCLTLISAIFITYALFPNTASQEKTIIVNKGTSKKEIAKTLAKEKIISLPYLYWVLSKILTLNSYIQAGEYNIPAGSSPFNIINMMKQGNVVIRKITIPEGLTTFQIIELIQNDPILTGEIKTNYKEGDFLPNTYFYTLGDTKQQILDKINQALIKTLENLWSCRSDILLKNYQQVLTLASIVEKETKFPDERALVASVFYNRLRLGMPLQADPTTIYAITQGKYTLERPLNKNDLQIISPFNTYKTRGLPPSPIANPGIDSIIAVLNPASTDYLYFVANSEGKHTFSAKLHDHNKHVMSYRKLRK